jgi:hypothetical protein
MNPYIMMLLQRAGASPVGQRGADILDQLRNFEGARIPLIRGAGGRYLKATPAQKIPLAPLTRGAAGLGAAGMVASDLGAPIRNTESLFAQLDERGATAAPSAPSRPSAPQGLIEQLNARGAAGPPPPRMAPIMSAPMSAADLDGPSTYIRQAPIMSRAMSAADLEGPSTYRRETRLEDAPMPPRRPEAPAAESILRRIFAGQDYQSNSRPVVEDKRVNWGDPESAADFFRADRAARELGTLPPIERASGGQVGQAGQGKAHKDAALVKALEIIERLMANGR